MSKFSAYLKELLDGQGESISRIAKNAGLERTSIHKALKDERLLSYTALKKLMRYLQLTLPQVRELTMYYEMLLQGEDIFRLQEAVCGIMAELAQFHFSGGSGGRDSARERRLPEFPELIYGKAQVENAVWEIWQYETAKSGAELALFIPAGSSLTDHLIRLWREGRQFTVCQLVGLAPGRSPEGAEAENLELLKRLLPLAFVSASSYHAYYYFESTAVSGNVGPLPYFIITEHFLIAMDEKLSAAQIQTSPELIRLYRKRFLKVTEECQPLCSYAGDTAGVLDAYMNNTDRSAYYTVMIQPCLGRYYTRERIERQFREEVPGREELIELSDRRFQMLRELKGDYYTVFSEEGLRQFAADGVAADLPAELILPVGPALRLELLREFQADIEQDAVKGLIADAEELPIPPCVTFTCDPRYGVHFYAIKGFSGGLYSCNLHIRDSGIGKAFCRFIKSLPGSRFVYEKERTLKLLDELCEGLERKIKEEADR